MEFWRQCSSCKKEISFESRYYECSVSTCKGRRTGYVFCSVPCFERHLPGARHRDAGAVECKSPSKGAWEKELANENKLSLTTNSSPRPPSESSNSIQTSGPSRRIIVTNPSGTAPSKPSASEDDVLVVVSKLKNYIRDKSEMNTSGDVADLLSHYLRRLCDGAIEEARREGRKTVMARDFKYSLIDS